MSSKLCSSLEIASNCSLPFFEFQALPEKETEKVRHNVLEVEKIVGKGWCVEFILKTSLTCNKVFTRGPAEELKNFANEKQVN